MTASKHVARRPRVVIVDVHASDSFREFAAALRRHGVDVVHLRPAHTGRGRRLKRAIDELAGPITPLYGPISSSDPRTVALRRELLAYPTVDVHAIEPVMAQLSQTSEWQANPGLNKLGHGIGLASVLDKWEVAQLAKSFGVAVPDSSLESPTDMFPVVVKGRLGAGGVWVRVVDSEQALHTAVAELSADGTELFFESYHPNATGLGTAGVSRMGEVLLCGAFERQSSPDEPLAPAVAIRAHNHQAAIEASERLISSLGYTGIFCLNFVPDSDGNPLLIDVNLRVFGAWATLDELGVPILGTYLQLIGAGPTTTPIHIDQDRWLGVARIGAGTRGGPAQVWSASRATAGLVWRRRSMLGWGWMIAAEVRVAQSAIAGLVAGRR